MENYLEFAKKIAREAGKIMRNYFFSEEFKIEYKEDRTPVTTADKLINDYLIKEVNKNYPEHSIDGEENKSIKNSRYVWVCDPIDGTSMFTRHVPVSMFSLALVIDGVPTVGVVYDPFLDEMYTAILGRGAYCNDKRIKVNNKEYGEIGSSITYCMWNNAKYDTLEVIKKLREDFKTCQIGSTVHSSMLVARGLTSAELFPGTDHGHCDIAASKLIVEEAGGKVTNFLGNDQRYDEGIDGAILTNGIIHDEIIEKVKKYCIKERYSFFLYEKIKGDTYEKGT